MCFINACWFVLGSKQVSFYKEFNSKKVFGGRLLKLFCRLDRFIRANIFSVFLIEKEENDLTLFVAFDQSAFHQMTN
jgi:hypothetical protein